MNFSRLKTIGPGTVTSKSFRNNFSAPSQKDKDISDPSIVWKPVHPNLVGGNMYIYASQTGLIKNAWSNTILKKSVNSAYMGDKKYPRVTIDGKKFYVHLLVYCAFNDITEPTDVVLDKKILDKDNLMYRCFNEDFEPLQSVQI